MLGRLAGGELADVFGNLELFELTLDRTSAHISSTLFPPPHPLK